MKPRRFVLAFLMSGFGLASQLSAAGPAINTEPSSASVVIGTNATFTVAATASTGTLTYQWQGSLDSGVTWSNIDNSPPFANVTAATLNVNAPAYWLSGAKVRCAVTDSNGTTNTDGLATLTVTSPAPLLILAHPSGKSAFQGDVAATTYTVVATGTGLTYQWQVSDNNGTFTNLADNATYTGSTGATLSIADPYANLGGTTASSGHTYRYRCQVTSGGTYTINSRPASLSIYATPTNTATVTLKVGGVTASTIAANSTSAITVQVSGIPTGDIVRVGRYADLNGNGTIDAGEPLVQSFAVTDGAAATYGGVTDPDIPGDTDLTADGTINASFYLAKSAELARGAGNYIFRVVSTTGAFRTVDSSVFTVTQPTLAHTISGTVNVPYAQVALLQQTASGDSEFIWGVVADGSGYFTLQADAGSYMLLALAPGYVANMATAPMPTVTTSNLTGQNVTLTAADYMNVFILQDQAGGGALRGVQVFFESKATGNITIANTDNGGVAAAAAVAASDWTYDVSGLSLTALGYVRPQSNNGSPRLDSTNTTLPLRAANALLHGTLTDNATPTPNPLANVSVNASDQVNTYATDTLTDATGHYYLPVYGTGGYWSVNVDNRNPIFGTSYSVPPSQSTAVVAGNAYNLNLVAPAVTAHLSGTVTNADNSGNPVSGVQVNLYSVGAMNTNFVTSVTTDVNGAFSFGVNAGSWQIGLDGTSAGANNLVAPTLAYPTVTDGNDVTGIALVVRTGTGTMSGTVVDFNGVGMSNANVMGTANISSVTYAAGAQTDGTGHYSFPVINGSWTVSAYSNLSFPQQTTTVSGATTTLNFSPTVFFYMPSDQSGITAGSSANFNAGVNAPGVPTMQWEVSTDGGSTWGNVPNSSPYSGVTSGSLNISPATTGLNGYQYRLAVSFTYNAVPQTARSTAATLTVTGTAPNISSQPISATITATGGTNFTFGASGIPSPSYQWRFSTDSGSTFNNLSDGGSFSGTQTSTLNVSNASTALNGYQFQCVVSNGVNPDAVTDAVTLTVNAQTQSVTFNGGTLSLNTPAALSASATSGLSAFNFTVQSATTTYDLIGGNLTITGYGSVTVRATQPGDAYYAPAYQDAMFTVNKLNATVSFDSLMATYDGTPKSATATTNPPGLTLGFTYDASGTPPTTAGSYAVVATIADATYQGSATDVFVISKAGQTISFAGPGNQTYPASPITLSASGGPSGNPVTFSVVSGPAGVSGTNGSTLTLTGTGTVVVRASQAGDANYLAAADVDRSITVTAASGFSAWQGSKFTASELLDANISGPNAVYGQDGLANLVKYALGLEPKQNITTGLPAVTTTATDWVYTYVRPDSITDVTYTVEYSTDLVNWTPVADSFVSNSTGFDTRQATYPLASATNICFRLKVTQP